MKLVHRNRSWLIRVGIHILCAQWSSWCTVCRTLWSPTAVVSPAMPAPAIATAASFVAAATFTRHPAIPRALLQVNSAMGCKSQCVAVTGSYSLQHDPCMNVLMC